MREISTLRGGGKSPPGRVEIAAMKLLFFDTSEMRKFDFDMYAWDT
jgi:hypothetical protein